jgi:hypothetical protein
MKRFTLSLLLALCVSIGANGQNPTHIPGDFGPDPTNIPTPTAPTAPPAGVPMLPFRFGVPFWRASGAAAGTEVRQRGCRRVHA